MIRLEDGKNVFTFRVAAVIVNQGKVLVHRYNDQSFYSLPGGRAEMLEDTKETILREMKEELDEVITIEKLLSVNELFFGVEDKKVHELGFYYHVSLRPDCPYLSQKAFTRIEIDGEKLHFEWLAVDDLDKVVFYPKNMIEIIKTLPDEISHLMSDDLEE